MDRIYRVKQGMGGRYAVERDGNFFWLRGDVFGDYQPGDEIPAGAPLKFLAPVSPSIVVCIGLNYKDQTTSCFAATWWHFGGRWLRPSILRSTRHRLMWSR